MIISTVIYLYPLPSFIPVSLLLKEDQVSARVQQNAMEVADTEKSAVKDCLVAVAYACLLYTSYAFNLYTPKRAQGRRLELSNIIMANTVGILIVFAGFFLVLSYTEAVSYTHLYKCEQICPFKKR